MKFDDLKISTKVALPAFILTLIAVVIVGLGALQARKVEVNTKILVEQRAPAELNIARVSRRVVTIGYSAYRTIAYDGGSTEVKNASADLDTAYKEATALLAGVKQAEPGAAKTVDDYKARLDKIYASARSGADLGQQDMDDAAKMVMVEIDPQITKLTADVNAFTNAHTAQTKQMVEKASKEAAAGTVFSILFGLIAAGAALVLALWIGARKIAAPLAATA